MMFAPLGILLLTKLISWVRRDRSHERLLLEQSRKLEASGESSTGRSRQRTMLRAALTQSSYKALPIWLRVTFVAFPSVSSLAFKAFRCDDLDDNDHLDGPAVMSADFAVTCWDEHGEQTEEYRRVTRLAVAAILAYPLAVPIAYCFLFWRVRRAVWKGDETPLAKSISFLTCEYSSPFFVSLRPGRTTPMHRLTALTPSSCLPRTCSHPAA